MLVKVCCIQSVAEAQMAVEEGAGILGLVSEMPSGPGVISLESIAAIVREVPSTFETWLLSSATSAEAIVQQHAACGTSGIQICDALDEKEFASLRLKLPTTKLIQVVHVTGAGSVAEAVKASEYADVILLDSGQPGAEVKTLGGTGNTHDWSVSKEICETIDVPMFLAGGLNGGNVRSAMDAVGPFGLDVCSGVREDDALSVVRLRAFMDAVKGRGLFRG
ncbi:MAG: phosphoribosylanthranilate isomerase [Candidatus Eisenbacteria bacterium]|uniref:N-(5'-phosphoribosyl)anthranilate isomerase n=1 Tax=Eiseniibacteriota bacterium TaxID=2212470 RepID=A0A7Y2E8F2_UNCEI|nr:phosphoribosylanthranilate isomerase [Candidatus Eisenbacteria bacterium]